MNWSGFIYTYENEDFVRLKSSKNHMTIELGQKQFSDINEEINKGEVHNGEYVEYLKELDMIVNSEEEEKKEFFEDIINAVEKIGEEYTVTILPTHKCNFFCTYCYENGTNRALEMTYETVDSIFDWIENKLLCEYKIKKLNFKLFGGEPLLVSDKKLEYIVNRIKNLDVDFSTSIITNGYCLTDTKCKILSFAHLQYLQVTLDGPRWYHDSQRKLKSGGETFDVIIENLLNAIRLDVSETYIIRINCCKSNVRIIPELLEYLSDRFEQYKSKINFSFGLLGKSYDDDVNKQIDDDFLRKDDGSLDEYALLYKKIKDLGFPYTDYYALSALCANKVSDSIIIQSDGKIIKCLRGVERREFYESDIIDYNLENRKAQILLYKRCFEEKCPYIPYCHLGCQHGYYIESGNKIGRNCQKEILDYVNKKLLEVMY